MAAVTEPQSEPFVSYTLTATKAVKVSVLGSPNWPTILKIFENFEMPIGNSKFSFMVLRHFGNSVQLVNTLRFVIESQSKFKLVCRMEPEIRW